MSAQFQHRHKNSQFVTLHKKALLPALEGESMTIDISEELTEDEFAEGITEEIEAIETAEFYVPDENNCEPNDSSVTHNDDASNIKIENVEHMQEKNFQSPSSEMVRFVSRTEADGPSGRTDLRKNLKCDICSELFPCYSLLKQHKYERQVSTDICMIWSI